MDMDMDGKTAVVTGAGKGIGLAVTYSLTDAGRAQAESRKEAGRAPWDEAAGGGDETLHNLRDAAFKLAAAAMQLARAGSKEQVDRAVGVLNEARRQLYAILAEDSTE